MWKKYWSVHLFGVSFVGQTLINLWWVLRPGKINSSWFVEGNILFGTTWVCLLSAWVLKLIREHKSEEILGSEFRWGRPLISLVASVFLANIVGFWLCNFRLCLLLLYLNLIVPIAWIVARKALARQVQRS